MNKIFKPLVGAAMLAALATPAFAQTNQVTTTGTTTIIRPVTISKATDLVFGRIVRPTTGTSTITIANNSNSSVESGAGDALVLGGITTSRATYTINGEGAQVVNVTVPATFDMTGPGTITVTLLDDLPVSNQVTLSNALGAAGSAALNIGGSFDVTDATVTGAYSGTFDVTVAYN